MGLAHEITFFLREAIFRLMIKLRHKKTLVFGPWVGEFGWELMDWQPRLNTLRKDFDDIVAISYHSSSVLYKNCKFFGHDLRLSESGFGYGKIRKEQETCIVEKALNYYNIREYKLYRPYYTGRIQRVLRKLLVPKTFLPLANTE